VNDRYSVVSAELPLRTHALVVVFELLDEYASVTFVAVSEPNVTLVTLGVSVIADVKL